jgi:hypothetical protein
MVSQVAGINIQRSGKLKISLVDEQAKTCRFAIRLQRILIPARTNMGLLLRRDFS